MAAHGGQQPATDGSGNALRRVRTVVLALLAIASFVLYAAGVLTAGQDRAPGWKLEAAGAIPAAVSYRVYGTPLGAVDDNVLRKFLHPDGDSVQDMLAQAADRSIPAGKVDMTTFDGIGAGTVVFATIAMTLFGPKIFSLVVLYLLTIGISVVAFMLRFQGRRLIVLPLYFLAATILLFTPIGRSPHAAELVPIGGQHYFVLAAFIPALHIFFEIIDGRAPTGWRREAVNLTLFLLQALLLFGALLVRTSTSYVLVALLAVWAFRLYRERRQSGQLLALLRKTATVAGAFALSLVAVVTTLPAYVESGRTFGNVWHRMFVPFSYHPDWPFGDLAKLYDCTPYIPEGLKVVADQVGHCVWLAYPPNAGRPLDQVSAEVYSGEYDRVMRDAYFYVLTHYPRQAFELYVYMKTQAVHDIIVVGWRVLFLIDRAPADRLRLITVAQLLVFGAFAVLVAVGRAGVIDRRLAIFPVFFVLSLGPLYAATPDLWTATDTVFLEYSCLALGVLLLAQLLADASWRLAPMPSSAR